MDIRSAFHVVSDRPGEPLVIRDRNLGARMSVTNDAEAVVELLAQDGRLPLGRRLFYYDSDNSLSEILIAGGNGCFSGFGPADDAPIYFKTGNFLRNCDLDFLDGFLSAIVDADLPEGAFLESCLDAVEGCARSFGNRESRDIVLEWIERSSASGRNGQ